MQYQINVTGSDDQIMVEGHSDKDIKSEPIVKGKQHYCQLSSARHIILLCYRMHLFVYVLSVLVLRASLIRNYFIADKGDQETIHHDIISLKEDVKRLADRVRAIENMLKSPASVATQEVNYECKYKYMYQ